MRAAVFLPLLACAAEPPVHVEPDVPAEPIAAEFTLTVDPAAVVADDTELAPVEVAVAGGSAALSARAWVRRPPNRPELISVELIAESHLDLHLAGAALTLTEVGGAALHDLHREPFGPATAERAFPLGGIAAGGLARLHLGLAPGDGPVDLRFSVTGTTTRRQPSHSAPLAVTPDGAELWVVVPDADRVVVVDAAGDRRLAEIEVGGRPTGLAVATDGRLVLVAAAEANQVLVIDRERRQVVQRFTEADGIGRDPRHVAITPDGSRALVSAYVGDRMTILVRRGDRYAVDGAVELGRRPTGIAVAADSRTALVSHWLPRGRVTENEAWVSVVDLELAAVDHEIALPDTLNLDRAHCLADVFGVSPERMTAEGVMTALAGVYLHPSGATAWIPHGAIPPAPVLERGPGSIELSPAFDVRPAEFMPGFVTVLDTRVTAAADVLRNPGALDRPVSPDYLACAGVPLTIEAAEADAIPGHDGEVVDHFAAFPTAYTAVASAGVHRAVAFTPDGRRAFAVSHVSDLVMEIDGTTFHPTAREHHLLSGANPTGMAIAPDGRTAWVSYANSLSVSVLDLSAYADDPPAPQFTSYHYREVPELPGGGNGIGSRRLVRRIDALPERPAITERAQVVLVDDDPMDPELRRGAILFTSSNIDKHPTLTRVTMTSCASCHPDGGSDGSMWGTMEGERRTMSLRGGVRGRGWLHASATHRDIREFVDVVIRERLGGEPSNADLDALARYVADGIRPVQAPAVDADLAAVGAGLFETHCTVCHEGPGRSGGRPAAGDPWGGGEEDGPLLSIDLETAVADAHVILPRFFESLFAPVDTEVLRLARGDRVLGSSDPLQQMLDFRARPDRARSELKPPSLVALHDQVLYFHDGRFTRLEDVVAYIDGKLELGLAEAERAALVEFLRTL